MPPLRASQVETLRLVAQEGNAISASELAALLDCSERAAFTHLDRLYWAGYLRSQYAGKWPDRRLVFSLTQLGREALEVSTDA